MIIFSFGSDKKHSDKIMKESWFNATTDMIKLMIVFNVGSDKKHSDKGLE